MPRSVPLVTPSLLRSVSGLSVPQNARKMPRSPPPDDAVVIEVAFGIAPGGDLAGDQKRRGLSDADLHERILPHVEIDEIASLLFGLDE